MGFISEAVSKVGGFLSSAVNFATGKGFVSNEEIKRQQKEIEKARRSDQERQRDLEYKLNNSRRDSRTRWDVSLENEIEKVKKDIQIADKLIARMNEGNVTGDEYTLMIQNAREELREGVDKSLEASKAGVDLVTQLDNIKKTEIDYRPGERKSHTIERQLQQTKDTLEGTMNIVRIGLTDLYITNVQMAKLQHTTLMITEAFQSQQERVDEVITEKIEEIKAMVVDGDSNWALSNRLTELTQLVMDINEKSSNMGQLLEILQNYSETNEEQIKTNQALIDQIQQTCQIQDQQIEEIDRINNLQAEQIQLHQVLIEQVQDIDRIQNKQIEESAMLSRQQEENIAYNRRINEEQEASIHLLLENQDKMDTKFEESLLYLNAKNLVALEQQNKTMKKGFMALGIILGLLTLVVIYLSYKSVI